MRSDDVRVRLGAVEERTPGLHLVACRLHVALLRLGRGPVERAAGARARCADDVPRAAQDRARRRAAHEERASDEQRGSHDHRAGAADQAGESAADCEADPAPVVVAAEERHQAEEPHSQTEPKRPHVEEVAAREHEATDDEEPEREHICCVAEHGTERIGEPGADRAAVETEVEDGGEHEAERGQAEPEQLVLVLRAGTARRPLPYARGDARTKRPLPPATARHARSIRRRHGRSCVRSAAMEPRLAKLLEAAPGPAPWYGKSFPSFERGGESWSWWYEPTGRGFGDWPVLRREGDGARCFVPGFYCYAVDGGNGNLLVWRKDVAGSGIEVKLHRVETLEPVEYPDDHPQRDADTHSPQASEMLHIPALAPGAHTGFDLQTTVELDEVLLLVSPPATSDDDPALAIYVWEPRSGRVTVSPQPWFTGTTNDLGYEWVTRVARDPKSGRIVGEGMRIPAFELADDDRTILRLFRS